jgi:hypothetical protein
LRRVRLPNVTRLLHFPSGTRAGNSYRESKILLRWKELTVIDAAYARFTLLTSTEGVVRKTLRNPHRLKVVRPCSELSHNTSCFTSMYWTSLQIYEVWQVRVTTQLRHRPRSQRLLDLTMSKVTLAEAKFCYFAPQMLANTASTQRTIQRNFYLHLPLAGYSTNTINESGVKPRVPVLAHLKQGFDGHVCRSCVQTSLTWDSASCKCFRETAAIWITNTISEAARQPKPKSMMNIHW